MAEGAEEEEEEVEEEEGAGSSIIEEDEVAVRMKVQSLRLLFFLSSSIAPFSRSEHAVSSTVDSSEMF